VSSSVSEEQMAELETAATAVNLSADRWATGEHDRYMAAQPGATGR